MRLPILLHSGLSAALAASAVKGAVIRSRADPRVTVNFNQTSICETTPGVKAYSGYVTLPASLDVAMPYESNMFFWFFESRNSPETAPLSIWLQGGPAAASIDQAVSGHNGPCIANPDSKTTTLNPNSWNTVANMLYIDQPVQAGFSYDEVVNGVLDMVTAAVDVKGETEPHGWTRLPGRFPSHNDKHMVNSTNTSAKGVYHLLQAWFGEFEQYRRDNISVWSQSYGGHYAPAVASLIQKEHKDPGSVLSAYKPRKRDCSGQPPAHSFGVDSVGIINGLIDLGIQLPFFPYFARSNPYGIKAYSEEVAAGVTHNLTRPGGCQDTLATCQELQGKRDQDGYATDLETVTACVEAYSACWEPVYGPFDALSGRYWFDIVSPLPIAFPHAFGVGYLNQPEVQEHLGARVNYTEVNDDGVLAFMLAGDFVRAGYVDQLASLVDDGVKVALINGDRDFRCNWVAGQAVSLGVNYSQKTAFAAAGYADLTVGSSVAGKVRQHGLFSFSRVFNAGHEVPIYKPVESLEIFKRTILGKDLATGEIDVTAAPTDYSTTGPDNVEDVLVDADPLPERRCYVLAAGLNLRCDQEQIDALVNGSAVVNDFLVVNPVSLPPSLPLF